MRFVPTSPTLIARIYDLREKGLSIRMIAALTGVAKSTVGDHIKHEGEMVVDIKCEHCGKQIIDLSGRKRYCNKRCATNAWREANREHIRAYNREYWQRWRK